ncbi:hypothetical protein pepv_033 [Penguinpox virus]|uniref:Uncharacterized protein n=1 Tax=Penguinpox virus TaxID=648998 RepID=A0A068EEP4_9POXV|nr:hypothetical protein HM90_gp033 [Penguinpox virus]AID46774.1 hypothetical protein pepv_033 [Penguinpox virus]
MEENIIVKTFDELYKNRFVNEIYHNDKRITFHKKKVKGSNLCYSIIEYINPIYDSCYSIAKVVYITNGVMYVTLNYMGKPVENRELVSLDKLLSDFEIASMGVNAKDLSTKHYEDKYKVSTNHDKKRDASLINIIKDNSLLEKLDYFLESYGDWKLTTIGPRQFPNKFCKYKISKYYFSL